MRARATTKIKYGSIIFLNLAIVMAIIVLFSAYMSDFNTKLYEQNLNDIGNVNNASALIASEISASHERKLNNIKHYISHRTLSTEELLDFVDGVNSDKNVSFQLIGADYSGYVIKRGEDGGYPSVSYQNSDYAAIQRVIDGINFDSDEVPFTVEFTDPNTGLRSFARYIYVSAVCDGEEKGYALLAVFRSSDFCDRIELSSNFDRMSTVIINADGGYALRNSDFKSDNFFKYLYVYNDLSLDEMNGLKKLVLSDNVGTLRYKNSLGEDCVFVYNPVPGLDKYCVSCVPLSDFHNSSPDFRFTAALVILLAVMMAVDITVLVTLNKRLKQSAREANAANEAKTDFLSRMSHDIRTPINVISGMTELALAESNSSQTAEYLGNIKSSGKFLLGLVNDILDMNKVESGNMELHLKPYNASEFATYLNAVIRPLCDQKGINFTIVDHTDGVAVMLDPLRFNQIFFNLLSNAVKFTSTGGNVTITSYINKVAEGRVVLDVSVSDDGIGMSEKFQKTMFAPFSQEERTLNQNAGGTGLGLAIVKRLVELMNGSIRVESAIGYGTTFFVHIEGAKAEIVEEKPSNAETKNDVSGLRVLLCEDHPLNAKIIVQLLAKKSVSVDTAENGKVGVEKFSASKDGFYDVILMDMRMPVMNGMEATREIRKLQGRADAETVPIIALTANAYDEDVRGCIDAGMNAHLAKPVDTETLCATMIKTIKQKQQKRQSEE